MGNEVNGRYTRCSYARRLQSVQTPIFRLAREIGMGPQLVNRKSRSCSEPSGLRKISANVTVQKTCESNGFAQKDLVWMIPVSCLTQFFWIYVSYKIYKRCRRNRIIRSDRNHRGNVNVLARHS